jgi:hypothetical protein
VYTWGWKECIPSEKILCDLLIRGNFQKDTTDKQNPLANDQGDFFKIHLYWIKQMVAPFNQCKN